MGQQQLLLIVLGVIIVGIAIAVGISMFKANAQSSNRDAIVNDLNNLAASAQQFYRKPTSMGGGSQTFNGFGFSSADTGNGNGSYFLLAGTAGSPPTTPYTAPLARHTGSNGFDTLSVSANCQGFYIVAMGTEVGNDNVNKVQAYGWVTPTGPTVKILN
jgi:type II secretory pathway pseudopilin PulG